MLAARSVAQRADQVLHQRLEDVLLGSLLLFSSVSQRDGRHLNRGQQRGRDEERTVEHPPSALHKPQGRTYRLQSMLYRTHFQVDWALGPPY